VLLGGHGVDLRVSDIDLDIANRKEERFGVVAQRRGGGAKVQGARKQGCAGRVGKRRAEGVESRGVQGEAREATNQGAAIPEGEGDEKWAKRPLFRAAAAYCDRGVLGMSCARAGKRRIQRVGREKGSRVLGIWAVVGPGGAQRGVGAGSPIARAQTRLRMREGSERPAGACVCA
jgi:hypothetical protein